MALRKRTTKLEGDRSAVFDLARGRLILLSSAFLVSYMLLAARAIDLTVIQSNVSVEGVVAEVAPAAASSIARANVFDRNGVLLATTLKTETLYVDPLLISSPDNVMKGLKKIFPNMPVADAQKKLTGKKRFVPLRRNLSPDEQYAVLQLGEPGLSFEQEDRRVYPQGALTSHLVGYSNIDLNGLAGIERHFNETLNKGDEINLTLDIRLQHVLRRELAKAIKDFNAIGASGVIMDANNGEILAGVSLPDFDPNDTGRGGDKIFNRLTLGVYELGSVFKIFSTAAYLDTHDVPMSKTFDATKPLIVGKEKIHDYHAENRMLSIPEVFMHSSNIGSAMMGHAVGGEALKSFYDRLGLTKKIDFEIAEVEQPQIPNPWKEISTVTASYGHGISVTPLHVASATASIVNGGYIIQPHLMPQDEENQKRERIVSKETSDRLRQLMRLVVTEGTGKNADVSGYDVGGKTGTADKSINGRYVENKIISSFVAAFPIEEPKYIIVVSVDEPKPNAHSYGYATAGWVAAPAIKRIVTSMTSILGMKPRFMPQEQDISTPLRQFVSLKGAHE